MAQNIFHRTQPNINTVGPNRTGKTKTTFVDMCIDVFDDHKAKNVSITAGRYPSISRKIINFVNFKIGPPNIVSTPQWNGVTHLHVIGFDVRWPWWKLRGIEPGRFYFALVGKFERLVVIKFAQEFDVGRGAECV